MQASEDHTLRTIAKRKNVGSVSQCTNGCIHIALGNFAFHLSRAQYLELMELLSESVAHLTTDTSVSESLGARPRLQ